ncbi:MAG: HAD family phosphatase, partial [Chloroflexi bacterium]|nr:HAD family phosphatase [Chloroflexota bacterium]
MPLSGRYTAVVFDMDGLLLDTETLWHEAEVELFARRGIAFTREDQMQVIGTSFDITARYFADRLGEPSERGAALVEEMIGLMHVRVEQRVQALPGAVELMDGLRSLGDVKLGL